MIRELLNNIQKDADRNLNFLHLTANENQISNTARLFLGSKISDRYYMGGGENDIVDMEPFTGLAFNSVEQLISTANEASNKMLSANSTNINVLSGVHAMMCSILATTLPGDVILTVPKNFGGHFATKGILEVTGRKPEFLEYDLENKKFDVEKSAQKVKQLNAKAIYLDVSYYLNAHNLKELRSAVGEEIIIIYDASHTMGLIMGQEFQAPLLEGADIVCANTHKTLPGPHKGMIAFKNKDLAQKANDIIDGCLYSSPHITHLISLAITILEMEKFGKEYAKQIIKNSNAFGEEFTNLGYEVRKANTGRYSENHQTHVFIDNSGDRINLYQNLIKNNISTNFDSVLGGRLFIRVGSQELTRRGLKESDIKNATQLIDKALKGEDVKSQILDLNNSFSKIEYSFDSEMAI